MKAYKNYCTRLFAWILCLTLEITLFQLFPLKVQAEVTSDGFYYSIQDDRTAIITGIRKAQENITIPSKIGSDAFSGCALLTTVHIPKNVTSVNYGAFSFCTQLKNFTVDVNNTEYTAVDGILFSKDLRFLVSFPAGYSGTYAIPEGVNEIENRAFFDNSGLTSFNIPNSVTEIGYQAFELSQKS